MANYIKVLQKLNKIPKFKESKTNLDNIHSILKLMGNPQHAFDSIHIAGTNGKGSVTLKIAKVLEAAGYRTGLFTSPHLFTYRERIQINGEYISKDYFADNLNSIFNLADKHNIQMAFFDDSKVNFASIEVGLGGRLDATNVINPIASVITSIDYDHCEILGNTLDKIAIEKAGIIKQKTPVILGPNARPIQVFKKQCEKLECAMYQVKPSEQTIADFDQENNEIVKLTFQCIKNNQQFSKLKINENQIMQGISFKQACRLEKVKEYNLKSVLKTNQIQPTSVLFDVGHNPGALEKSLHQIQYNNPKCNLTVIYGTSSVKDDRASLKADHFRAKNVEVLQESVKYLRNEYLNIDQQIQPIIEKGNIKKTIQQALAESQYNDIIVINGSFFIMREAREFFQYYDEKDIEQLNTL